MTQPAPSTAAAFFAAALTFQTDVADVHAAVNSAEPGFTLVDARGLAAWRQARIPGALHLPTALIPDRAPELLAPHRPVVTYCWGPGCNGATKAALALSRLGYRVREMIGGIEYWIREGFPVETDRGLVRHAPDPLTTAAPAFTCDC
jgi:rhodanese-related sulfurtransferase